VSAGKILIIIGGGILIIGLLIQVGLPLGRLPGDIRISRGNFTLYSPLMTGLLISIALTIIINLLLRR
jgi:Protein of unknown function (DUF2905)